MRILTSALLVVLCKSTSANADQDRYRNMVDPKTVQFKILDMVHVAEPSNPSVQSLPKQPRHSLDGRCNSTILSDEQKEALGCTPVPRHPLDAQCRSPVLTASQKAQLGCPSEANTEANPKSGTASVSVSASSHTTTDIVSRTYSLEELCQSTTVSTEQKVKLGCPVPESVLPENSVRDHKDVPHVEATPSQWQHRDSISQWAADLSSKSGGQSRRCQSPNVSVEMKRRLNCPEHLIQSAMELSEHEKENKSHRNRDEEHNPSQKEDKKQQQLELSDSATNDLGTTESNQNKDEDHHDMKESVSKETKQLHPSESSDENERLSEMGSDETHATDPAQEEDASRNPIHGDSQEEPVEENIEDATKHESDTAADESSTKQDTRGDPLEKQRVPEDGDKDLDVGVTNKSHASDGQQDEDTSSEPTNGESQEEESKQHNTEEVAAENDTVPGESATTQDCTWRAG